LLLVDQHGVHSWDAEVEAGSDTQLRGLETEYDGVPVVNWVVRGIARQQHDRHVEDARSAATSTLERLASDRMDREVQHQLVDFRSKFVEQWFQPLNDLQLQPQPINMHTTTERLVVRYRLASDHQLAAHTPRPQAPADSLLSVQIHQTALNNTVEQLKLESKRSDLRELYREIGGIFNRQDIEIPEDVPDDVTIQFDSRDAIRLSCRDGRVTVTMRFAELKNGRRRRWRNFAVRAYFIPQSDQLAPSLVRDGYIELAGQRLNTFDQIALRGIFTKVLSRNRPLNLMSKQLLENEGLGDLDVTQFVIRDGWIGFALGKSSDGPTERVVRRSQARLEG
jgi:hypothetical protein